MSKKNKDEEDYSAAARNILEDYQQILNKAFETISESQKKLIESTSEFYAAYFSIMGEIMRKSFDYYSTFMGRSPMYPPMSFWYQQRTTT